VAKKQQTPPPAPAAEDRELTVGGKPIPTEIAHLVPYANTDQGIAERMAKAGDKVARVEMVRDEHHKKLDAYAAQPWDAAGGNPMKEVVDKVREPGFSYKMLSPRVVDRRGLRGFEAVPEARYGNMFVGRMPIEERERRNEHYRREGLDRAEEAAEVYQENQERLVRDGGVRGLGPLPAGEVLTDARDPERAASIGHSRSRG
jgi:hypothetical protein